MKNKKIDIFDELSNQWWDLNGAFKALHSYNFVRINYIKNIINSSFNKSYKGYLNGLTYIPQLVSRVKIDQLSKTVPMDDDN